MPALASDRGFKMMTLSVCMIVKNEEDTLARCLDCIKDIADEIVIVDTGSSDKTVEIAGMFTKNIYHFAWIDDFAAARNFAFSKATMEYTMWLDADDVIDESNRAKLKALKVNLKPEVDMVMLKYDVAFDENGEPTYSYYRERIMKTANHYQWIGAIHEVIQQSGHVIHEEISIHHKKLHPTEKGRNLRIFEKAVREGKQLDPRQQFYFARELYYNGRFEEAIEMFTKFLDAGNGWVENNISACKDLSMCHYAKNDEKAAIASLFRSFEFDLPRAEILCDIGLHYMRRGNFRTAAYWYHRALDCDRKAEDGGFFQPDCYGFVPSLQLCVCYDRMGNRQLAIEYNERAGAFKPNDRSYLYNKQYFENSKA